MADGEMVAGQPGSCARQKSRARDVGPVVSLDCMPISKEGEESGVLCLKICQSLRLHVTHSMLFPARLCD